MQRSLPSGDTVPAIALTGVYKTFSTASGELVRALENANLTVHTGEFITVVGASGCGKTTLLRLIAGLDHCRAGSIDINGEPLIGLSGMVGIVFQDMTMLS